MKIKRIKKVKRKKRYNANVNRKRLRNKLRKLPNIPCDQVKEAWERKKSIRTNLNEMGLAYDANKALKISNSKQEMLEKAKQLAIENERLSDYDEGRVTDVCPSKKYIVEQLEADAKAPRKHRLNIPKPQAEFLTYLIKKYGEDYKAMSRDKKNYYQLTWKQIRAKIKLFKGIPQQYNKYLQNTNIQELESEVA